MDDKLLSTIEEPERTVPGGPDPIHNSVVLSSDNQGVVKSLIMKCLVKTQIYLYH